MGSKWATSVWTSGEPDYKDLGEDASAQKPFLITSRAPHGGSGFIQLFVTFNDGVFSK